jgi:hypothetical protein
LTCKIHIVTIGPKLSQDLYSCKRKRELYLASRNSENPYLIGYYKKCCKILSIVIKEAKKLIYEDIIKKSRNRNKTVWDIVKLEINKSGYSDRINTLNVRGTSITNSQEIVNVFNKYFLSIAKNINSTNTKQSNYNLDDTTPIDYLLQSF